MATQLNADNSTASHNSDIDLEDICEVIVTFQCKSCPFKSNDKDALRIHFKEHQQQSQPNLQNEENNTGVNQDSQPEGDGARPLDHEKEVFLCAECNIVFPTEEACCAHMIDIHGLKDFDANLIRDDRNKKPPVERQRRNVKLPKSLTLEEGTIVPKRYRVGKDMPLVCSMCPVRFDSNETIKLHEQCHIRKPADPSSALGPKEKTTINGFNCLICATKNTFETFSRWSKCALHLWKVHQIDCDLYGCPKCQFKTHLITKLKEHEAIHTSNQCYKCETCHKTFKQQKQLRTHEKYHKEKMTKLPPPGDSRWYTPKECTICKRILSDSKCLKKHISAVHNKLKPYACNICGHTSARKAELQLHIRQHTGEKPYKCSTCEFATGDHNSLRKHQLRHTEIRPYACPFCHYRCIQSCAYKKHMISVHSDKDAIYACPFCPLISVSEVIFQAHIKDHEEGRVPRVEMHNESSSSPIPTDEILPGEATSTEIKAEPEIQAKRKSSDLSYWMREEDSIDMVDTGGFTIPAPVEISESVSSKCDTGETETALNKQDHLALNFPTNITGHPDELSIDVNSEIDVNDANETLPETSTCSAAQKSPRPEGKPISKKSSSAAAPLTASDLALEEVLDSDQTNNETVFARLLGLQEKSRTDNSVGH